MFNYLFILIIATAKKYRSVYRNKILLLTSQMINTKLIQLCKKVFGERIYFTM